MKILPAIDIKDGQAVRLLLKEILARRRWSNPDVLEQAPSFKAGGYHDSCG